MSQTPRVKSKFYETAGGIDALLRKMAATAYYPDLFAWAFGSATISEPVSPV